MVGNLADLVFDGQTAITQRGLLGPRRRRGRRTQPVSGCHYIGNAAFVSAEDESQFRGYAGIRPRFLAMLPWVVADASRPALRAVGAELAPGSGSALENDYLESAIVADLPFPPDARRRNCVGVR
jgi:hypothetical protein